MFEPNVWCRCVHVKVFLPSCASHVFVVASDLDAKIAEELELDLRNRFRASMAEFDRWLQGTVDELRSASQKPADAPGVTYAIKHARPANGYLRSARFEIEYEMEYTSSSFGSWTAHVLSKSAQGEDGKSLFSQRTCP